MYEVEEIEMRITVDNLSTFMKRCQDRYEITANNLANSNNSGFKKQLALEKRNYAYSMTDTSQGSLEETGNKMDLAISGKGYFVVQTPQGGKYTRSGDFSINEKNQLVDRFGQTVLSNQGTPLVINGMPDFDVDGNVYSDGLPVGRLALVKPDDTRPVSMLGGGIMDFSPTNLQPGEYSVQSGYLEASNVNVLKEMVSTTETLKNFEFAQRILKLDQDLAEKCAREVGSTRV